MMSETYIEDRLKQINERIERACETAGRDPREVELLLATKTVPVEKIQKAIAAGGTLIGENKVQELRDKQPIIGSEHAKWHFIGHLQSNKVRNVLQYVSCIQSVDRLKLGKVLHNQLSKENKKLDILVQVNTSYEDSKFGVAPEEALHLIEQLAHFDSLQIKGLMTIGKFSAEQEEVRKCFRLLKSIQQQAIKENFPGVEMDVLSMGMSGDLEIAVEEGATIVRVGTAIFGERMYPDSYYWNEKSPSN